VYIKAAPSIFGAVDFRYIYVIVVAGDNREGRDRKEKWMITDSNTTKRPYELTGPAYAVWYEVGRQLGVFPQSAIGHALCNGSYKLPANVDPYSVLLIKRIAASRGIIVTAA
jgi:hypothetical protein